MKKQIGEFLKLLSQLTQDEADFIEQILIWDDETKAAYLFAKKLFEEEFE